MSQVISSDNPPKTSIDLWHCNCSTNLRRRSYILTNVEAGEEVLVQDASDFEAKAGITLTIISRTANPKQVRQKFVTIDGVRYTADYAE